MGHLRTLGQEAGLGLENDIDVILLGAGMAGLVAARALAERGLRVCVLEAKERVGGRVMSQKVEGGGTVELGAEFVHGRAPELWALIDEVGAKTVERNGSMLREECGGGLVEDDPQDESMFEPLEQLEDFAGEDRTFADWLAASDVDEDMRPALRSYVEGFNAADARRIGVRSLGAQQKAEAKTEGDRSWHVEGGYSQLAEYLAARVKELGGEVRLGCEVLGVRWSAGKVFVETTQGDVIAPQCVVTLPLGVVQTVNRVGGIRLDPEPRAITQARRMEMGHALRFTMVFRERWWERSRVLDRETLRAMSFLFTSGRMPPVWWTSPTEAGTMPALTGWVGGPRARALEGKSAEALAGEACAALAKIFAVEEAIVRAALVATYTHDWSADRFTQGAYSYVPVGAMGASAVMAQPEAGTMFFAGEHTDVTGNWGTVHAAIRSGLRAAAQILKECV
jgi:monoamine oxidase